MDEGTFFNRINEKVMPKLRCLARGNRFYEWKDLVTIQSENGTFMCQATPKNSGGEYIYIGCWEVEQRPTVAKGLGCMEDDTKKGVIVDGTYICRICSHFGYAVYPGTHLIRTKERGHA